jgi:hypothetical protein
MSPLSPFFSWLCMGRRILLVGDSFFHRLRVCPPTRSTGATSAAAGYPAGVQRVYVLMSGSVFWAQTTSDGEITR